MKRIIIIGGGISGLAALHYLVQKYKDRMEVEILLFEKNREAGGTIQTQHLDGCTIEGGPNGFLNSKTSTIDLSCELGLEHQLIAADRQAKKRFVSLQNKLHLIPDGLFSLLSFEPLSLSDKLRIPLEFFAAKRPSEEETIYAFGARRFGENFSKIFLDAMATGIFAGDVRNLNLKLTFPKVYETEQRYGSLIRAMFSIKKEQGSINAKKFSRTQPRGTLMSFAQGMSQLTSTLTSRYQNRIRLNCPVISMVKNHEGGFCVKTSHEKCLADEVFLCVPAYCAATLVRELSEFLSVQLNKIEYAPLAVAAFVYDRASVKTPPLGFGYLIPSLEKKQVLGVLLDSNIFPQRTGREKFLFRVMMGGVHHPEVLQMREHQLFNLAKAELNSMFLLLQPALKQIVTLWPKAIPQYTSAYANIRPNIAQELSRIKNFYIVANYLNGVSVNDCIENAQAAVLQSRL